MEELAKKFAEYLGDPYVTAVGYAALAYGLFHWLDEKASDEAKAALARTMLFKDYKNEQVASALVEVFDWIYTYPLLSWRAFFRSLLFTTVVSTISLWETGLLFRKWRWASLSSLLLILLFNFLTDYLSLFVIGPLLIRSGTKPVIGLALGAVSAAAIVLGANYLRTAGLLLQDAQSYATAVSEYAYTLHNWSLFEHGMMPFGLAALAVFVWLPLFALGILVVRLLSPLSWMVGRTQWFLKEGKEHPLKAIGYVAAVVVFVGAVAGRWVFSAL
jgi:hypothetical protein